MRRWIVLAVLAVGCGGARDAERPSRPGAPATQATRAAPAPLVGEAIGPVDASAFGRVVAIDVTKDNAVSIDEAGRVRISNTPLFTGDAAGVVGRPFSQPVEEVVFVRHVALANVPGAVSGEVFCARTRAGSAECLTDYVKTELDGRRTRLAAYRFRLPARGRVTHLGVAEPPVEPLVCVRTDEASTCWLFSFDGKRAEQYAASGAAATAMATLPADVAEAWQRAEPGLTLARARGFVASEARDYARILEGRASIGVRCARIDGGTLSCFGAGVYGELGDGVLAATVRASRPMGSESVVDVDMTGHYACAVTVDGAVACWGKLPDGLPVNRRDRDAVLPMCTLDRQASAAHAEQERKRVIAEAAACSEHCKTAHTLDCNLNCATRCVVTPYEFRHDTLCQEPYDLDQSASERFGARCAEAQSAPSWLSDQDLRAITANVSLTLKPAFVRGISDAVNVAVWGPHVCVVRRSGEVLCVPRDDDTE